MRRGVYYSVVEGPEEDFRWLARHGFDAVVTGDDPALAALAREHELEPWTCLGTFQLPSDDPSLLCVDLNGGRQKWFGSGCPNDRGIREASLAKYREAASGDDIAGVFMDGVRYASPASGLDAFFTCFCERCAEAAVGMGFDWERMRQDVTALCERVKAGRRFDPLAGVLGVSDWLTFRARVVEQFVGEVAQELHDRGKQVGGYLFSPCLASLVGQDYAALARHVDVFSPMLYRNAKERNSVAPVNTEIHALASWCTKEKDPAWALDFFDLPGEQIDTLEDFLTRGLSPDAMRIETARARAKIGKDKSLVPILWWDDPEMLGTISAVEDGGADGVSWFLFAPGLKEILEQRAS